MPWLDVEEFRMRFIRSTGTNTSDDVIGDALRNAIDQLAHWCGETIIREVKNGDILDLKVDRFRRAQSKLALRDLLPILGDRISDGGITVRELDLNGETKNEYLSPAQIKIAQDGLLDAARALIGGYVPAQSVVSENFHGLSQSVPIEFVW